MTVWDLRWATASDYAVVAFILLLLGVIIYFREAKYFLAVMTVIMVGIHAVAIVSPARLFGFYMQVRFTTAHEFLIRGGCLWNILTGLYLFLSRNSREATVQMTSLRAIFIHYLTYGSLLLVNLYEYGISPNNWTNSHGMVTGFSLTLFCVAGSAYFLFCSGASSRTTVSGSAKGGGHIQFEFYLSIVRAVMAFSSPAFIWARSLNISNAPLDLFGTHLCHCFGVLFLSEAFLALGALSFTYQKDKENYFLTRILTRVCALANAAYYMLIVTHSPERLVFAAIMVGPSLANCIAGYLSVTQGGAIIAKTFASLMSGEGGTTSSSSYSSSTTRTVTSTSTRAQPRRSVRVTRQSVQQ